MDGTKLKANASMAANRGYAQISGEVDAILAEAAAADTEEDARLGDRRGDELPAELADRTSRRARLRQAKARLEAEVDAAQDAHREHLAARAALEAQRGRKLRGRKPKPPAAVVDPAARANVTDPDSRLMGSRPRLGQDHTAACPSGAGPALRRPHRRVRCPRGQGVLQQVQQARHSTLSTTRGCQTGNLSGAAG